MKRQKQKQQPSLDDLIKESLRLSEQQLELAKQHSKAIDLYCQRIEVEIYRTAKGIDKKLLNMQQSKLQ